MPNQKRQEIVIIQIKMTELSIANNSLNVELDDHHNRITIIHRFLQRTYFTLRNDVWINSRVDAELITRTRNFIQKRGSNVNLDTNCLTIIQNQQEENTTTTNNTTTNNKIIQ